MSDLISRKEIIDRLERVIQNGVPSEDGMHPISAETVLEVVKELSEHGTNLAEVGTDCISREQAINALSTITMYKGSIPFDTAVMRIEQLPSAQPKWMKAKWKPVEVDSDDNVWLWECENCHEETEFKWDFCPVCGCEMTNATKVNG